jgi:hypothetical protein
MAYLVPFQKTGEVLQGVAGFDAGHPWRDHIVGGQAEGMDPNQFDIEQLSAGVKEELEHTADPNVAAEIAMDHLAKDPDYYKKLQLIDPGEEGEAQAKIGAAKLAGVLLARRMAKEAGLWGAIGAAAPAVSGGAVTPQMPAARTRGMPSGSWQVPGKSMQATRVGAPPPGLLARAKSPAGAMGPGANAAKTVVKGAPGAVAGAKRFGWGKAGLLAAAGLGAYGLAKAVPKALQMAKEEGSMPQASGGGWSPVPYGHGYSPWGNGAPNMGAG